MQTYFREEEKRAVPMEKKLELVFISYESRNTVHPD